MPEDNTYINDYVTPEKWGSTWSTPTTEPSSDPQNWGLGGQGVVKMVGEYTLHKPALPSAMCTLYLGLIRSGVNPNPPSGSPIFGPIYADVTIGYGAAAYQFSMDWAQGASISVPAGKVTVNARQGGSLDYKIQLSAGLAIGPRGVATPPSYTQYFAVPPRPGSAVIQVPNRARGLLVPKVFTGRPSDFEIWVMRGPSAASDVIAEYNHAIATDSEIWTRGVQLPGGAQQVQIFSTVGTLFNAPNAIFLLDG
jgi:hypothetical protein